MERQASYRQSSSSSFPSLSNSEWEALIDDFSSLLPARRTRWLHLPLADVAVAAVLRRDAPFNLKSLILLFLEDHFPSFPSPSLIPLLDAAKVLLPSADPIRDQFLTTLVSIAIVLSASSSPVPSPVVPQLSLLVELLLNVINRPNHGPDRALRGLACECLRQLEIALPGLLSDVAGHIFSLASAERTHVMQAYALLLASVALNLARLGDLSSSSSVLATVNPLIPFEVPGHLVSQVEVQKEATNSPSEINLKDIGRVISFLLERPQAFTPTGIVESATAISEIAMVVSSWAPAVAALVKVQFSGLIHCYYPLLAHVVLMLYCQLPDDDDQNLVSLASRLALVACETHQPLPFRILALHWLLGTPRMRLLVPNLKERFFPTLFDPLAIKAKKLDVLAAIAAGFEVSDAVSGETIDRKSLVVELVDDGFTFISSFRWLPHWSTETSVAFRALNRFLVNVSPHNDDSSGYCILLTDSVIFDTLQNMLVNLALEHHGLVPVIASFADRLLACKAHHWVGEQLLSAMDERLFPKLEPGYELSRYYPLFEKIVRSGSLAPRGAIELLTKQMVCVTEKHGPDTELRSWSQGSKVMSLCHMMLMHHSSSRVFIPLSHLLAFTIKCFPDLEIRDRARILLRMLACIPGKKLRHIMEVGQQPSGVRPSASVFNVESLDHVEDSRKSAGIASYIQLERITPLVVKQPWSLALPNFSILTKISRSSEAVGIQDVDSTTPIVADVEHSAEVGLLTSAVQPLRVIDSMFSEALHVLQMHFSCIPDYRHMPGIKIRISCILRFQSEPFILVWGPPPPSSVTEDAAELPAIYAAKISFSSTGKFGKIPPCRVPFLLGEPPSSGDEGVSGAENHREDPVHCASVVIELEPREPMPALIDVSLEANAENGQVISGRLQPVMVSFEDMFCKAMVPSNILEHAFAGYYFSLFDALWEACGNTTNIGREPFTLRGGKGVAAINGTRSVKLLEVPPKTVVEAVERHLAPYVISASGASLINIVRLKGVIRDIIWEEGTAGAAGSSAALVPYSTDTNLQSLYAEDAFDSDKNPCLYKRNMGTLRVLIFLPPRFHLLFLLEVGVTSTLVRIRTDYWPCLAFVDEYWEALLELCSSFQ